MLAASAAQAQQTIKIGMIEPYSGQFADAAKQQDNAIKLFMKQHGDTVAGKKIEIVRKDVGGINPPVAKRLAQELVTRDKVDILAGFVLTPNGIAAGERLQGRQEVHGADERGDLDRHHQVALYGAHLDDHSAAELRLRQMGGDAGGVKKAYTMVTDYGPGHDAESSFQAGFKGGGGKIVGSVRMPVRNPDFSAYVQRAKDLNPQGIFVMIPGGAQPGAFGKAIAERGIDPKKTKVLGQMEITDEHALKSMGDIAEGIITSANYDYNHKSKMNAAFVKAYNAAYHRNPDFFAVGAWDGMHLIYAALKKTKGKTDARQADRRRQGHEVGKPARHDRDRSEDPRHRADRLCAQGREGRRQAGQCRDRQDPERQGPAHGKKK